jgi:hypothetical protein
MLYNISFFLHSFIHMCIHCLGHFSPLLPAPSLSPQHPSLLGRTCPALFSNFVEEKREDISNNKKDIAFLLVWHKDSYTEKFLALLPRTCVLQPELIHLYLTSSLLPGHLPILTSIILRLLY